MVRVGRPRGQRKAERRLKRELANKEALRTVVTGVLDLAKSFTGSAVANPVVGLATSIITLDLLHRFRVISDLAWALGFAGIGLIEVGSIAGQVNPAGIVAGVGNLIPSVGSKSVNVSSPESLIATSPNPAIREDSHSVVPTETLKAGTGYVPE